MKWVKKEWVGSSDYRTKGRILLNDEKGISCSWVKMGRDLCRSWCREYKTRQQELQKRVNEIRNVVHPDIILGLSYHALSGKTGFTHYAVVEVSKVEEIPAGMVMLSVPTLTYATCVHLEHQSIDQSYYNIYTWINNNGYKDANINGLTHCEEYPMNQDPYVNKPVFQFLIVVENRQRIIILMSVLLLDSDLRYYRNTIGDCINML